jgi:hypothetical protein
MNEEEKSQEETYRRGYQDGCLIAVMDFWEMMSEKRMPQAEADNRCYEHGSNRLLNWMLEPPAEMVLAPAPQIWEPENRYDQRPTYPGDQQNGPQVHQLTDLMKMTPQEVRQRVEKSREQ